MNLHRQETPTTLHLLNADPACNLEDISKWPARGRCGTASRLASALSARTALSSGPRCDPGERGTSVPRVFAVHPFCFLSFGSCVERTRGSRHSPLAPRLSPLCHCVRVIVVLRSIHSRASQSHKSPQMVLASERGLRRRPEPRDCWGAAPGARLACAVIPEVVSNAQPLWPRLLSGAVWPRDGATCRHPVSTPSAFAASWRCWR